MKQHIRLAELADSVWDIIEATRRIHDRVRAVGCDPAQLRELAGEAARICDRLWALLVHLWDMFAQPSPAPDLECLIAACEGARAGLIPLFRFGTQGDSKGAQRGGKKATAVGADKNLARRYSESLTTEFTISKKRKAWTKISERYQFEYVYERIAEKNEPRLLVGAGEWTWADVLTRFSIVPTSCMADEDVSAAFHQLYDASVRDVDLVADRAEILHFLPYGGSLESTKILWIGHEHQAKRGGPATREVYGRWFDLGSYLLMKKLGLGRAFYSTISGQGGWVDYKIPIVDGIYARAS